MCQAQPLLLASSPPPNEKEELGSPETPIPFQVSAIIPVIPDASGVTLKPKDYPMLKLVQPCWFFGFITVIRLRHQDHIDFGC